jgi:hypothetical protein
MDHRMADPELKMGIWKLGREKEIRYEGVKVY